MEDREAFIPIKDLNLVTISADPRPRPADALILAAAERLRAARAVAAQRDEQVRALSEAHRAAHLEARRARDEEQEALRALLDLIGGYPQESHDGP